MIADGMRFLPVFYSLAGKDGCKRGAMCQQALSILE